MVPAIIAASVALVVAVLTPAITSLRARRQAIADLFDDAVSALLLAQTSRHYPSGGLPADQTAAWTRDEERKFTIRMGQTGIERWLQKQEDARLALARLETFVPEIRGEITQGWEIREDQEPTIRNMIEARRREAIKSERLFRLRRTAQPSSLLSH
jgi:hypothetical protein